MAEKFVDSDLRDKSLLREAYVSFPVDLVDQEVGGVFGKPIDAGDDKIYFYNVLGNHQVGVQIHEDGQRSLVLVRESTHDSGEAKQTITRITKVV